MTRTPLYKIGYQTSKGHLREKILVFGLLGISHVIGSIYWLETGSLAQVQFCLYFLLQV